MAAKYVEPSISARSFNCPHCGAHTSRTWFSVYCERIDDDVPWRTYRDALERLERDSADGAIPADTVARLKAGIERLLRGEVFLEDSEKNRYGLPQVQSLAVSLCYVCNRPAVWLREGLLYPPIRTGAEPSEDMPPDVLADYEEARSIIALSPRGAAALLRLGIQKLCNNLGEKGKKLDLVLKHIAKNTASKLAARALPVVGELILVNDGYDTAVCIGTCVKN